MNGFLRPLLAEFSSDDAVAQLALDAAEGLADPALFDPNGANRGDTRCRDTSLGDTPP